MNNTLILIDWDDTLFPTTWTMQNNLNVINKTSKYINLYTKLDTTIYNFLQTAIKYGFVIIITNASMSWINTCMNLLPKTKEFTQKNIKIVSARDNYGTNKDMFSWKKLAFKNEVYIMLKNNHIHNIISIGDAIYEYQASIDLHDWDKIKPKQRIIKTIKFMETPNYYSLIDQINLLNKSIYYICAKKKHMDLIFSNN